MTPEEAAEFSQAFLNSIARLPPEQQSEAIHRLINSAMREMPEQAVREIRADIVRDLDPRIAIVSSTLDLIDGNLALREMQRETAA